VFEIPEGSKTVRAIQNLIISRSLMIRWKLLSVHKI
jgi:hypothetical protein